MEEFRRSLPAADKRKDILGKFTLRPYVVFKAISVNFTLGQPKKISHSHRYLYGLVVLHYYLRCSLARISLKQKSFLNDLKLELS